MHAVVYNKSPSWLNYPVRRGDSVCVHLPRVLPNRVSWADRTVRYICSTYPYVVLLIKEAGCSAQLEYT